MFERFNLMIGDSFEKIQNKAILIIGIGGVGSYALESLIRSGIKKVIIVDFDKVDITNLNRQLMTLKSNIGEYKVDVFERRINDINDACEVKKIKELITTDNIDLLFEEHIDYLIDACDTIPVKKEIIRRCLKDNIKFISCMGTGNKLDPKKLEIVDVRKTSYDPIAKIIRKMVKDERLKGKIPVVCSNEQPIKTNANVISSNSFVPASAGLLITSYVINDILKENS